MLTMIRFFDYMTSTSWQHGTCGDRQNFWPYIRQKYYCSNLYCRDLWLRNHMCYMFDKVTVKDFKTTSSEDRHTSIHACIRENKDLSCWVLIQGVFLSFFLYKYIVGFVDLFRKFISFLKLDKGINGDACRHHTSWRATKIDILYLSIFIVYNYNAVMRKCLP